METNRIEELEARTLGVTLADSLRGGRATLELSVGVEIVAHGFDDDPAESFREAIRDLRHGLALVGMVGKMRFILDAMYEEESEEAAKEAMDSFAEEEVTITLSDVTRAHDEEVARLQRERKRFAEMAEFVRAQQGAGDEDLTLGEAIARHEEGTERLQRLDPQAKPGDAE